MSPVRSGGLRQRVTLYDVPGTTQDAYGQTLPTGSAIGTFWASVSPLKGRRVQNLQTTWPLAYYEVDMRWLGSAIPTSAHNPLGIILPRMYLILTGGRRLDVVFAANVEERNHMWKLTCEEKVTT